jgi:hypothetical protein
MAIPPLSPAIRRQRPPRSTTTNTGRRSPASSKSRYRGWPSLPITTSTRRRTTHFINFNVFAGGLGELEYLRHIGVLDADFRPVPARRSTSRAICSRRPASLPDFASLRFCGSAACSACAARRRRSAKTATATSPAATPLPYTIDFSNPGETPAGQLRLLSQLDAGLDARSFRLGDLQARRHQCAPAGRQGQFPGRLRFQWQQGLRPARQRRYRRRDANRHLAAAGHRPADRRSAARRRRAACSRLRPEKPTTAIATARFGELHGQRRRRRGFRRRHCDQGTAVHRPGTADRQRPSVVKLDADAPRTTLAVPRSATTRRARRLSTSAGRLTTRFRVAALVTWCVRQWRQVGDALRRRRRRRLPHLAAPDRAAGQPGDFHRQRRQSAMSSSPSPPTVPATAKPRRWPGPCCPTTARARRFSTPSASTSRCCRPPSCRWHRGPQLPGQRACSPRPHAAARAGRQQPAQRPALGARALHACAALPKATPPATPTSARRRWSNCRTTASWPAPAPSATRFSALAEAALPKCTARRTLTRLRHPLFTLDAPIVDMAVDRLGQLWVMTGAELLQVDAGSGEVIDRHQRPGGDPLTHALAIDPASGEIYVSSGKGIEIFDPRRAIAAAPGGTSASSASATSPLPPTAACGRQVERQRDHSAPAAGQQRDRQLPARRPQRRPRRSSNIVSPASSTASLSAPPERRSTGCFSPRARSASARCRSRWQQRAGRSSRRCG